MHEKIFEMIKDDMICNELLKIKDMLIDIRRTIHQFPEPAFNEFKTGDLIKKYLDEFGVPYKTNIGKTGIVGIISGKEAGKTVALRADMDALDLEEKTGHNFKSQNPGFMHACGHDGHVAILLGTALMLSKLRDKIKGNIKLIFQPAEEGPGGALYMIKDGVMENPKIDAIFGLHIHPEINLGGIELKEGAMTASADEVRLTVTGKGGHAATPHKTVDAITVSALLITAIQQIISRKIDPVENAVITFGRITGGTRFNIIADKVELHGTIRAFNPKVRTDLINEIDKISKGITDAFGGGYKLEIDMGYPATYNDKELTCFAKKVAEKLLGKENVREIEKPGMGGEDFSFFTEKAPGCFIKLGGGSSRCCKVLHHAEFDFEEDALLIGTALMTKIAKEYLEV